MRTNTIYSLAMCVALCSAQQAYAQNQKPKTAEEHQMLMKVVQLFENYEIQSAISHDKNTADFLALFEDPEHAHVFRDIYGIAGKKELTATEYAKSLHSNSTTTDVRLLNINSGKFRPEDGVWKYDVDFEKKVNLANNCGVEYSSDFFVKDKTYHLTATIVFSDDMQTCRFEKIVETEGKNAEYRFPEKHNVVVKHDKRDSEVFVNDNKIEFNGLDQAFVPYGAALSYPGRNVKLVQKDPQCNLHEFSYNSSRMHIKPYFNMPLAGYYSVKHEGLSGLNVTKNSGMEFGLDFGYDLGSTDLLRYSINAGVAYAMSTLGLKYESTGFSYEEPGSNEVDGDKYIRYYKEVKADETVKTTNLVVPIYFDLEFTTSDIITEFVQVGVKNYLGLSSSVDNNTTIGSIYGYYPAYKYYMYGDHFLFNGFGTNPSAKLAEDADHVGAASYSVDLMLGAGVRVNPSKSLPLSIELGVGYQMGLGSAFDVTNHNVKMEGASGKTTYDEALSHYTLGKGEELRALNSALSSWKRNHLNLNIGVIYRF